MADTKISALTDGGAAQPTDDIPAVRAGGNVRVKVAAAGSDTQIQFNDSSAFGASPAFRYGDETGYPNSLIMGDRNTSVISGNIVGAFGTSGDPIPVGLQFVGGAAYDNGVDDVDGGALVFAGGVGARSGTGGPVGIVGGSSVDGNGGDAEYGAGTSTNARGGDTYVFGGTGGTDGGDLYLDGGAPGSGSQGNIIMGSLPTSDPGVSGALWVDGSGFLKVSP